MKSNIQNGVIKPSGKGWLPMVKKSIQLAGSAATVLLASPLKLPGKIFILAQYIAVIAGIVKVTGKDE
ncbi:hypothetical protein [Pedobacter sp. N23S346]|uniref:hypothetical protein n=1 Tax=Pedobacter sp. N23S346 TaxID=3402750 RepID=UPI003AD28F52